MNLARVENYAADVLSRVERIAAAYQAGSTPDGIPSWSPAEWHALKAEWDILSSLDTQTPESAHRLSQLRHTFQYQPRLTPTDGTALVGLMIDHISDSTDLRANIKAARQACAAV